MEAMQGTPEVFEFKGSALSYGREHILGDDCTVEVERQGEKYRVSIRVAGRVGRALHAQRLVRSRRKI